MTIDDMEPCTVADDHRVYAHREDLELFGVYVYVEAIEVFNDTPDTLCAVGPYNNKLEAALVLACTTLPQTVRSKDGRQWLILFSNMEANDE